MRVVGLLLVLGLVGAALLYALDVPDGDERSPAPESVETGALPPRRSRALGDEALVVRMAAAESTAQYAFDPLVLSTPSVG